MKLLLTSAGIKNVSIHEALVKGTVRGSPSVQRATVSSPSRSNSMAPTYSPSHRSPMKRLPSIIRAQLA
jgi:hypothetical protein